MEYEITLCLPDGEKKISVPSTATLEDVKNAYADDAGDPVVLAEADHALRELKAPLPGSCTVRFLTMTDHDGQRTYRRSVIFLMQAAAMRLWGDRGQIRVRYSLGEGYFCSLLETAMTKENIAALEEEMKALVKEDLPLKKSACRTVDAERMFEEEGLHDKARLLHFRQNSLVNLYSLCGVKNYFYGYMVPSTGYLRTFSLMPYEDAFVLLLPDKNPMQAEPFCASAQYHRMRAEAQEWSRMLDVHTIGALNEAIAAGRGNELILLQEAMMEERIASIAQAIYDDRRRKFIMIAGPSSSGKTSFANRLCIQLLSKGLQPHLLSLDDYYVDRQYCPRDENGEYDFECLNALDVPLFQSDMRRLLLGETVRMPSFNFKTGSREYHGSTLTLREADVLVIEGIHGLNDTLTQTLPDESKYRIFISALTQLNIDEHNPLSTTDGRLIRRIVRDARSRGSDAQSTIAMWDSVRRGEEENIFPYQDSADAYFNSAFLYELPVLKVYAEPLLYQVPRESPQYAQAKRLLKLLAYFLPMPTEAIPSNSLMKEFIGGSCFFV